MKNRWYDKYPLLAEHLENLKAMEPRRREKIATGIVRLINEKAPNVLAMPVFKGPQKTLSKRWYDKDPILWLAVNALKYLDEGTLQEAMDYLLAEIECNVMG